MKFMPDTVCQLEADCNGYHEYSSMSVHDF